MNKFLIFVTLIISLYTSCTNSPTKKTDKKEKKSVWSQEKLSPNYHWLRYHEDFESQQFIDSFYNFYTSYLTQHHIDSAADFLDLYAGYLNIRNLYDSTFTNVLSSYLNNYSQEESEAVQEKIPFIQYHLSYQYKMNGEMDKAIYWRRQLINHPYTLPVTKGYTLSNLGNIYVSQGKVDSALPLFLMAAAIHREMKDTVSESMNYSNIARVYAGMNASDEAISYFDKSIAMLKSATLSHRLLINYYFAKINFLYYSLNDSEQVGMAADTMKIINDTLQTRSKIYAFETNAAQFLKFTCLKKQDSCNYYLQKCAQLKDSINNVSYNLQYSILAFENEFNEFNRIINEDSLLQITKQQEAEDNVEVAEHLYGILYQCNKVKSPAKALQYLEAENNIKAKRLTQNNKGRLFDLEKKYESAKKEQQIVLQKETIKSKNKTIVLLFTVFGFIGLAALAYSYWLSRNKLKKEKEITAAYTKQLFEKTEEERKRIATDLHDSISHELMNLKSFVAKENQIQNQKIDTIINDIRILSRNLHPVLFEKVGLKNTIEQMIDRVQLQNNFMLNAEINYENGLTKFAELQVYRIIQEAITNMLKHANAIAGKINITETQKEVVVEIKDNGTGFDADAALHSGSSFGLHNIIERSRAIGGKANIVSGANGTTITITIIKK
jgi:two-component system NarL family sensor kinase